MAEGKKSFLLGSATLVVWGGVTSTQADEDALNDWWTNEHLPERLSIPGFLRARRYACRDDSTKSTEYMTFYEVSKLDVLTSEPYMEKLNNPTPGTKQHLPTLATMNRAACQLVHSESRIHLNGCMSGLGATVALLVLSLPAGLETVNIWQGFIFDAFDKMQKSDKSIMSLHLVREDAAATQPGSTSQSYINSNLKSSEDRGIIRWVMLLEFSRRWDATHEGVRDVLKPVIDELSGASEAQKDVTFDIHVYDLMCSVNS